MYDALRGAVSEVILVANDPRAEEWLPGVRTVADGRPERGSLVGVHSALSAAVDDVLLVAWDMPFVTTRALHTIRTMLSSTVSLAVPETSHGVEPFCAAWSRRCLTAIDGAIAAGELRLSSLVDTLPVVRRIGIGELGGDERLFFNVNTAADLETAERMARGG